MKKKFIVIETKVIGTFEDRDDAWDYMDKMQEKRPNSKIQWHTENIGDKMINMKHKTEFIISITAGTNLDMSKKEFEEAIVKKINELEIKINSNTPVRFHMKIETERFRLLKKWNKKETDKLVQKIKDMGKKDISDHCGVWGN